MLPARQVRTLIYFQHLPTDLLPDIQRKDHEQANKHQNENNCHLILLARPNESIVRNVLSSVSTATFMNSEL